jgi:Holliday junction resolvase RusA-like endonuclease
VRLIARILVNDRAVPWSTPETIMVPAANGKRRAVHKKDKRLIAWQDAIRAAHRQVYGGDPYEGPVLLCIRFFRGTDDRNLWGKRWWNRRPCKGHSDLTNLQKSTEDGVKTYRVFAGKGKVRVLAYAIPGVIEEDSQVCDVRTRKRYGPNDGCDIRVYALED